MADDKTLLRVENLNAWFYTEEGIVKALENVSFSVGRGEILGLVGETGCGKSVTSSCIMRLIPSPPGKIIGGSRAKTSRRRRRNGCARSAARISP